MGQDKALCTGIMLCQITAILSGVAMLYLAVIVIIPSKDELSMGISISPIMCSTIQMNNIDLRTNDDGTPAECKWASCREWCLSKDPARCLEIYVRPRFKGSTITLEDCDPRKTLNQQCSALNISNAQSLRCKKGECKDLMGVYNCSRTLHNDCHYLTPAYDCRNQLKTNESIVCGEEKCVSPLEGVVWCDKGECWAFTDTKTYTECERKCSNLNLNGFNSLIFSTEHLYGASCKGVSSTNGTVEMKGLTDNVQWQTGNEVFMVFCTYVTYANFSIIMEDCFNGTLGDSYSLNNIKDYVKLQDYHIQSSDRRDWLLDTEEELRLANDTKLLFNAEGCSNTLTKECTKFFDEHIQDEKDGRTRHRYPCYYTKEHNDFVTSQYNPDQTKLYLILASSVPSGLFILSCGCLFLCSRLVLTNDEGHLQFRSFKKDPIPANASELWFNIVTYFNSYSQHVIFSLFIITLLTNYQICC